MTQTPGTPAGPTPASEPETAALPAVEAPTPAPGSTLALVAEAAAKSGLLWVDVPGDRAWPVWHEWLDGTAWVVSGPGEQPMPWLPEEVPIILRSKDSGGRLVRVQARVERITPADVRWESATAALKAARLNSVGDDVVQRWAELCTVTALTPFGEALEGPGSYDDASGAAPPAPTPATTRTWRPWHLGGRPKRRRGTR
ncbi:MAG: hypothetical protein ACXVYY_16655 [Oryzihumus sp.]